MRTLLFSLVMLGACSCGALAQLSPERYFYGVNRSIPMTVATPEGAEGEVEIALFEPGGSEPVERASAEAGRVDLAALFPVLWTSEEPSVRYAQLVVGGEQVGSPVVLTPMRSPRMAVASPAGLQWAAAGDVFSGMRAYEARHVVLETTLGEIEIRMRPDMAPNTVEHFLRLVEGGYYTDIIFHRVVPQTAQGHPFVIQAGDPTGVGSGGPGVFIDLEPSDLPHDFGVLSMARTQDPNTNGGQFFLCLSREGTAMLDGNYTAFGQTVRGAETILEISSTPLADVRSGRPAEPPVIERAYTVAAPPFGETPDPVERPETAPPAER